MVWLICLQSWRSCFKVYNETQTVKSCDFKLSLVFKLHDLFNVEDQSVLKSTKDAFEEENMAT